jgi:serine/threonine-protein kinase
MARRSALAEMEARRPMQVVSADLLLGTSLGMYRLEAFMGQDALGLRFGARGPENPPAPYHVRVLSVPPILQAPARTIFEDQFHIEASQLALLQHPYLLPLIGYGIANVMPYMVWPAVSMRTLSSRLQASGPLDLLTAGRYLDQIAAVLEYAHEHATLHGGLSTDCLYLRPDGRLVVGDLGVWRLVEQGIIAARTHALAGTLEACAPEQITGNPVDPRTDVYALGAILYRLLSGVPIFTGNSFEAIAQQHLRAPVPSLSRQRMGVPLTLDDLLATALAKDPAQRFPQAGALANAYHAIVAPAQATRVPFVSTGVPSLPDWRRRTATGNDLPSLDPRLALPVESWDDGAGADGGSTRGPRITERVSARGPNSAPGRFSQPSSPIPPTSRAVSSRGLTARSMTAAGVPPYAPSGLRASERRRFPRNLVFLAAVVLVVAGSTLGLIGAKSGWFGAASHATGTVLFLDNAQSPPGFTDATQVSIHDLAAPPSGSFYDAWLIDSASEHETLLGTLTAQNGAYALTDPGDGHGGAAGTNLLAAGDEVEITVEQGHVQLPVGTVVLKGAFPAEAFVHMRHLLVSFPSTPNHVGLVVGLLNQAQLVDAQAQILKSAADSQNTTAVRCVAQSMVDIIEGQQGAHYQPLGGECAAQHITATGDGFGLLGANGYLAESAQHASNAAISPDATSFIKTHAGHVEIATNNIKGWLTQVENDAVPLLANPAATGAVAEMVTLADHAYHGVDTNGDEQVDPVVGEAGAVTAYEHAQLMATLTLSAA